MKEKTAILGVYCLIAIIITWPLIFHLNTLILDIHDGLLNTWMLNWVIHSFTSGISGIQNFYNANIFYPYQNTFAFSDLQLPLGLIVLPFVLLSGEPLVANNICVLIGLSLTAFSAYLLAKFLTKKAGISFLVGVLVGFSTIHLNYIAHQQSFHFWPIIFGILFLLKKNYRLYILFFLIAGLTTPLNLYFLLTIVSVQFILDKNSRISIFLATFVAAVLITPALLPYWLVSKTFHYQRPIQDAIHFSLQIPDLINVGNYSRLKFFIPPIPNAGTAYPGLVMLVLALLALKGFFQKPKKQIFLIVAGLSFILALGPAFHIFRQTIHVGPLPAIPLPYTLLYYLVPGFAGFRTPSRWMILVVISLCCVIAIYFKNKINWKTALILSALVIFEINFPLRFYTVPSVSQFPPEQQWLANNYSKAPIIQFPIYRWDNQPEMELETLREYYSTIHWHPMYNGYSGFSPKEWEEHVAWLQKDFPSPQTVDYLKSLKIKLILVPKNWEVPQAQKIMEFPNTTVYEI